ncbi:hypothetical protein NX868_30585 [Burkholderia thailandensis]|uniref:Membrane protein n=1 Tax=Burkholderia oklahomensis TaxID=342113 RepID=A0AAI8B9Q3_9BURK|nr:MULTISPECIES: hypothetical protein [pseudomallei group]AIO65841.1 putative membrane protein [Burkholderia oklahomensis]AIO68778.1 putative membrane protein [Burkholderia oklahomensis]AIP63825.1 hypothetical protein DR62_18 [Burkholderia thailandensis]AIP64239.1 hypothetical protein DR62_2876 [Burkholderia thailandensis]AJX32389.1 putative membrane protein [Burkholderia oklahomensis C6786]
MKRLLCVALIGVALGAHAAQGIDVVVCGAAPASAAVGVQVPCTLSDGSAGVQQVTHLTLVNEGATSDAPISGGIEAGMAVGSAVFLVLAIAFGMRALRRFVDSASES